MLKRYKRVILAISCSLSLWGCAASFGGDPPPTGQPPAQPSDVGGVEPGTPLPGRATPLIPPFTPAAPCDLQNDLVTISDENDCRSEQVIEVIAADGDGVVFIHRTFIRGYGCWSGINSYTYGLYVCELATGERLRLTDKQSTPLMPSPDAVWYAFGVVDVEQFQPHVYRVRSDGMSLQQLDTQGFPDWAVSVALIAWSADGEWLEVKLWDGSADGWHRYRVATDGSGSYESLP